MEDEECLPENSSLKLYLQNLGFTDFPITKIKPQDPSSVKFEVSKPKANFVETIDEDVVDQINIIVSTQMLFEEDISKIENLLSNFKIVKNGMLKSMFKSLFGIVIIVLGLCLFWVIGYYAFFVISSFYAFIATEYLSRKHFNRGRLKKLTSILQTNFILLKKTVKFIEENRLLEANICKNSSEEFIRGFDFYNNFKSDFIISINEIINILLKSTQKLILKIPLLDYIESPEFYLCNNIKKNYESINMSNLYEVYLLMQSEFLLRVILSLIPNINLSTKNGFHELNKILTETCISLLKLKNKLNKKFKFLFLNGIHSSKSEVHLKLPSKHNSSNKYSKEFILSIHETSNTFQRLLLQSRILEEKIMSDKISEFIEEELVKMQQSLNTCQRNINDSLILFKKVNFVRNSLHGRNEVQVQDERELGNSIEKSNKFIIGYSDLDPKIEDEIFEACFSSEKSVINLSDVDVWDLEEKLIKKQKKEFCKNVMNELKVKLKEKAKNWKKRERELLKRRGKNDVNEYKEETETSDEEKETEDNIDNLDIEEPYGCKKISCRSNITSKIKNFKGGLTAETSECQTQCENSQENYADEKSFESRIINEKYTPDLLNESFKSDIASESFTPNFSNNFLNDLNKARQKILKSCVAIEEETFYATSEDSSSEDNHFL